MQIQTKRDPDGGWYDRVVRLVDDDGQVVEEFGKDPTLDELREAERRHGVRINLWQQGLVCSECGNQINDRFSAKQDGHLLCWDCATSSDGSDQGGLRTNADPTKSVLSESKLHKKSLCDYVINVATGCRHGCKFCYVPSTPAIDSRGEMLEEHANVDDPQKDWGDYLLYRDDLPERVHQGLEETNFENWKTTDRGRGIVMLSSGTDCYQDRRAAQITRGCVHELIKHDIPTRILTRSPNVTRDIDLFQQADGNLTVGTSIPSFDTALIRILEPNAPPPAARWEALNKLFQAGIPRYVSFSPTYPTMDRDDIHEALSWFSAIDPEVVFHEPINPRGINFEMCVEALDEAGMENEAREFEELENRAKWRDYAISQIEMVREVAGSFDNLTVHTWPSRDLIRETHGKQQNLFKQMKRKVSPESFAQ